MQFQPQHIIRYFESYKQHLQYVAIAHTPFRAYAASETQIENMKRTAQDSCRHAVNCFAKSLYPTHGNLVARKPELYRPLTLATVEGARPTANPSLTIHYNIFLGNIPAYYEQYQVLELFRQAWHVKAGLSDNIRIYTITDENRRQWIGYCLKEIGISRQNLTGEYGTWDIVNSYIPHQALAD